MNGQWEYFPISEYIPFILNGNSIELSECDLREPDDGLIGMDNSPVIVHIPVSLRECFWDWKRKGAGNLLLPFVDNMGKERICLFSKGDDGTVHGKLNRANQQKKDT